MYSEPEYSEVLSSSMPAQDHLGFLELLQRLQGEHDGLTRQIKDLRDENRRLRGLMSTFHQNLQQRSSVLSPKEHQAVADLTKLKGHWDKPEGALSLKNVHIERVSNCAPNSVSHDSSLALTSVSPSQPLSTEVLRASDRSAVSFEDFPSASPPLAAAIAANNNIILNNNNNNNNNNHDDHDHDHDHGHDRGGGQHGEEPLKTSVVFAESTTKSRLPTTVSLCAPVTSRSHQHSICSMSSDPSFFEPEFPQVLTDFLQTEELSSTGTIKSPLSRKQLRKNTLQMNSHLLKEVDLMKPEAWWIIHPHAVKRTVWDILSVFVVGYDVVFIPLDIVGIVESTVLADVVFVMDWVTALFWTFDMIMSFITGFHSEGIVELEPKRIARAYLRSWFCFDIIIVTTDWIFLILQAGANAILRIGKSTRATRIVRTMRLARSVRLHGKLLQVLEAIQSEGIRISLNLVGLAAFVLIVNHYFACGWYYIGLNNSAEEFEGLTWLIAFKEHSLRYQYTTALHWSLTQFTPAAMEVVPTNYTERLFAILTLMFAMMTFSTFLSSITSLMTSLRKMRSEPARQQKILMDFFAENKISAELSVRIWNYLRTHHFRFQKRSYKKDIAVFKLLPPTLTHKLNEEIFMPILRECPFFYRYGTVNYTGVMNMCSTIMTEGSYTASEEVFIPQKKAQKMLFLTAGRMHYHHPDSRMACELEAGSWICEPCLWFQWHHFGQLVAATHCEVVGLDPVKFRADLATHARPTLAFVKTYVQHLTEYMQESSPFNIWWTDIWFDAKAIRDVAREANHCFLGGDDQEENIRLSRTSDIGVEVTKSHSLQGAWIVFHNLITSKRVRAHSNDID